MKFKKKKREEKYKNVTPVVKRFGLTKKNVPTLNQIKLCLVKHFNMPKNEALTEENALTKWEQFTR